MLVIMHPGSRRHVLGQFTLLAEDPELAPPRDGGGRDQYVR
jgi:hypothetical protein